MENYDALKLDNQLCFPLYAASREVIRQYRPFLDELGLTYTQYIVMLVIWETKKISVKDLGKKLYLDSGTLTPVLKSLEAKGLVTRCRSVIDERVLIAEVTHRGTQLRDEALAVPDRIMERLRLDAQERAALSVLLRKLLGSEK